MKNLRGREARRSGGGGSKLAIRRKKLARNLQWLFDRYYAPAAAGRPASSLYARAPIYKLTARDCKAYSACAHI